MTRQEFLKTFPAYFPSYMPSAASRKRIANVSLLIIIGPTGVGKTSVINKLGLHYVPTDVTRPPRPEEKNGVDMFFVTDYDQIIADIKAGQFLQFVIGASGDFYGTRASSYPTEGWAVMPVIADVVPAFRKMGFKDSLSVFITPPAYEEWMRRLRIHDLDPGSLDKRLQEARRSFKFALSDDQTHFILNDRLDDAVRQVKDLLDGKVDLQREKIARAAAESNYNELIKPEN